MVAPLIPVAAGLTAVVAAYETALSKISDPAVITALGPQSALDVSPVTFQSVEQEGRWKPASLMAQSSNGRIFELALPGRFENPVPKSPHLGPPKPAQLQYCNCPLFSLDMPCIQAELPRALQSSTAQRSTLLVDAAWWCDGVEIHGGYAGLASAQGFGSVWDTTAHVSLQATPWGNSYPAAIFLTWSGWVNPIGPQYWEFRGGLVVRADTTNSGQDTANPVGVPPATTNPNSKGPPAYMQAWARDDTTGPPQISKWDQKAGFTLTGN